MNRQATKKVICNLYNYKKLTYRIYKGLLEINKKKKKQLVRIWAKEWTCVFHSGGSTSIPITYKKYSIKGNAN